MRLSNATCMWSFVRHNISSDFAFSILKTAKSQISGGSATSSTKNRSIYKQSSQDSKQTPRRNVIHLVVMQLQSLHIVYGIDSYAKLVSL